MCGIAGAIGSLPDRAESVGAIVAKLHHRGPDEGGQFHDRDCTLAMRRLSIIDLAGGHQPLFNEARNIACICNGEIYNFQNLSTELRGLGHVFDTQSDIEVVVHGYEAWGDDVLTHLNGMFALAVWDARRQRLLLARDRLGKKPLYYWHAGSVLVFASELRSLMALPGARWTVDSEACRTFCLLGYMLGDRTPISEIRRLPPGHCAVWEGGRFTINRYWEPQPAPHAASAREAADALLPLLENAVQLRLISDVPLGAFLSGGLDSSLVVAIAAGRLGSRIPTFSVSFPGYRSHDESNHARQVADYFGCEHHEFGVEASDFKDLANLVWALDEPLADPAALPTLLLSREARRHVTVALTGEGADEVFGGYERYSLALLGPAVQRRFGVLGNLAAGALRVRGARATDDSRTSRILRSAATGHADPLLWSQSLAFAPAVAQAANWTGTEIRLAQPPSHLQERHNGKMQALQLDDLSGMLVNGLLTKVDRMTMAASLEARCPFLDYRIVNFGLGLPDEWKIRGRTTKVLLRLVAQRLLPETIYNRPKHTFRLPMREWLRGPLKDLAREAVSSSTLAWFGIVVAERVRHLAEDHIAGRADFSRALWALITLNLWLTEARRQVTLDPSA